MRTAPTVGGSEASLITQGNYPLPLARLDGQLTAPHSGELVVLRPPAELADSPRRFNPALVFEAMECR
jgi:hypothetical protein